MPYERSFPFPLTRGGPWLAFLSGFPGFEQSNTSALLARIQFWRILRHLPNMEPPHRRPPDPVALLRGHVASAFCLSTCSLIHFISPSYLDAGISATDLMPFTAICARKRLCSVLPPMSSAFSSAISCVSVMGAASGAGGGAASVAALFCPGAASGAAGAGTGEGDSGCGLCARPV